MGGRATVAVYRPGFVQDGRRVAGPDEDAFTLAATALERLVRTAPPSPSAVLHLVGTYPPPADWGFSALTGTALQLVKHPGGPDGLRDALESLREVELDAPRWLVAAEIAAPGDAAALALRLGPGEALLEPDLTALAGGSVWPREGAASAFDPDPADDLGPARPLPPGELALFADADLNARSEGAYVPRARYLENLPSRWRLAGVRCDRCGAVTFPVRASCRICGARDELSSELLPLDGGTVVAATTIGRGGQPTEFDAQVAALGEFGVVLVELAPGVRLTLQVTDAGPSPLAIGSKVRTRLRRLYPMEGEWRYGRKAVAYASPVSAEPR